MLALQHHVQYIYYSSHIPLIEPLYRKSFSDPYFITRVQY